MSDNRELVWAVQRFVQRFSEYNPDVHHGLLGLFKNKEEAIKCLDSNIKYTLHSELNSEYIGRVMDATVMGEGRYARLACARGYYIDFFLQQLEVKP